MMRERKLLASRAEWQPESSPPVEDRLVVARRGADRPGVVETACEVADGASGAFVDQMEVAEFMVVDETGAAAASRRDPVAGAGCETGRCALPERFGGARRQRS